MKKTTLLIFALLLLSLLVSCTRPSAQKDPSPFQPSKGQSSSQKDTQSALELLSKNTTLPALPGEYLEGVDTEAFEKTENGELIEYSCKALGLYYVFEKGESDSETRLISVKFTSARHAIFGISVGDMLMDAELMLSSSGFSLERDGSESTFTKGALKIRASHEDGKISGITVSL